ncbi:MAG: glutamate synthase [Bacillota bacterium]|nr:MAG: glutamate synthase [Bacillota bacterium]
MKIINANNTGYKELNEQIRRSGGDCRLTGCLGQRFIATGLSERKIIVEGTAGNALGAYLNGSEIIVRGNAQDAVGDTMNDGKIVIHGNIGDAAGYAMRGGGIFVKGNAGYRVGIHMKEYKNKVPVIVVGGKTGSFLGEYQAGGIIIVLGLEKSERAIVGNFPCMGMHGGKMLLRSGCENLKFPKNVHAVRAGKEDMEEFCEYISEFCELFDCDRREILNSEFTLVTPDSKNPYKQMYVMN